MALTVFFRNNVMIGAAEILCRLPLVFTAGYLARVLGTEAYGHWVMILIVQSLLVGIAGMGFSSSISRLASVASSGQAVSYLWFGLRLAAFALACVLALVILLQEPVGHVLNLPAAFRGLLPVAIVASITGLAEGMLEAYFKARSLISRQILLLSARTSIEIVVVLLIFGVLARYSKIDAPGLLLLYLASSLLMKLVIYAWLLRGGLGQGKPLDYRQRHEFVFYGLPMVPAVLVSWFVSQGDRLVINQLVDPHELGIYAFGAALASYIAYLGYAIYPLMLPEASRIYDADDHAGLRKLFSQSQQVYLALLATALAFIALFGMEIILWTAGSAYLDAVPILLVIAMALGIEHLLGIYQYVFHLVKRTRWIFWFNLIYGGLMMTLVYGATYFFGISGAPWAVLAAVLVSNALRYTLAQRELSLPLNARMVLATVLVISITLILHFYSSGLSGWQRTIIFCAFSTASMSTLLPAARKYLFTLVSRVHPTSARRSDY